MLTQRGMKGNRGQEDTSVSVGGRGGSTSKLCQEVEVTYFEKTRSYLSIRTEKEKKEGV